jgi:hypothetical protein
MPRPLAFKFKWLTNEGQPMGLVSKRAQFDDEGLRLDDGTVPAGSLLRAQRVLDRVVVEFVDGQGRVARCAFQVTSPRAEVVRDALNVVASRNWAEHRKRALREAQSPFAFRVRECPHCGATVEFSGRAVTPQLYCPYCESIGLPGGQGDPRDRHLGLCDACGFYARPVQFTEVFFWFAFVVYGFTWRKKLLCRACMRAEAWTNLAKNLVFVLGVPFAAYQVARAYAGGHVADGPYAGLDGGNAYARARRCDLAVARYLDLESRLPHCAGVRFNRGRALARSRRQQEAVEALEAALRDCSNFEPAYKLVLRSLKHVGRHERAAQLRTQWGDADQGDEDATEGVPAARAPRRRRR